VVFEIAHGAERHVDVLVQVVITVVDDMFQDAAIWYEMPSTRMFSPIAF